MKPVKGLRHVAYEAALQWLRLFFPSVVKESVVALSMYKIMHGLLDFPCDAVFAAPTRFGLRGYTFFPIDVNGNFEIKD